MSNVPLADWLAENNLSMYLENLEDEGYDVEVLSKMNDKELTDVMDDIEMKKGHRRKLPLALARVREEDSLAKKQLAKKQQTEAQLQDLKAKSQVAKARLENEKIGKGNMSRADKEQSAGAASESDISLPDGKRYKACDDKQNV